MALGTMSAFVAAGPATASPLGAAPAPASPFSGFAASSPVLALATSGHGAVVPATLLNTFPGAVNLINASALQGKGNLIIPRGSTTIIEANKPTTLNLGGSLSNFGTLILASNSSGLASLNLLANGITNYSSGVITNFGWPGKGAVNLLALKQIALSSNSFIKNEGTININGALSMQSRSAITNSGSIYSTQNLRLSAPSFCNFGNSAALSSSSTLNLLTLNLSNQGSIVSLSGNINIAPGLNGNLSVNNIGGTIQAANGSLNFRDAHYSGSASLQLSGGELQAQELNFNNGSGNILADPLKASGMLNTTGGGANLGVFSQTLSLGNINVSGDPTYYNDTGSIAINGNIHVTENLAIIAAGDISSSSAVTSISTSNAAGLGHDIYLIAGASITGGSASSSTTIASTPPLNGNAVSNITINGASASGGNVDFSASPNLVISSASTCSNCKGGNLIIDAFAQGSNGGGFTMPGPSTGVNGSVLDSSSLRGTGGNVSIIAGVNLPNAAIEIGRINASGSSQLASGNVSITTAEPLSSNAQPLIFNIHGAIISNNSLIASPTLQTADVNLADNINARAVNIQAGGSITTLDAIVAQVSTGAGSNPNGTVINSAGTFVYTVDANLNQLDVISTTTNRVVATKATGVEPIAVALSPDGATIYVADQGSNDIRVYNAANLQLEKTISAASINAPLALALNGDGSQLYEANSGNNSFDVINTKTLSLSATVSLPNTPQALAFVNADASLFVSMVGTNNIASYNSLNGIVGSISTAAGSQPYGLGPCPCGTKFFVPSDNGAGSSLQIVSLQPPAPSLAPSIPIVGGSKFIATGILPNGSYAYVANPNDNTISILTTLTSTFKSSFATPQSINASVNGAFAGFVGNNPIAYVPDGDQVAVLRTAAIIAPYITLDAKNGSINAASGASSNISLTAGTSAMITSNANLSSSGATAQAQLQLATTGSITFNGPVSAGLVDCHAINGTFTNDSSINVNGALLFVAAPNIVNNGAMQVKGTGAGSALNLQASNGVLHLQLGTGSQLDVLDPNSGVINLNGAGGTSITVVGNGTISASSYIEPNGDPGLYTVNIDVKSISGNINFSISPLNNPPSSLRLLTAQGDIMLADAVNTSTLNTGSGGNIFIDAMGGNVVGTSLTADAVGTHGGVPYRGGNITVEAKQDISFSGAITSSGSLGADGGTIKLLAQHININGVNSNSASLDVSSSSANGGAISVNSLASVSFFVDSCKGCYGTFGSITAAGAINGGTVNISAQEGFSIASTLGIFATGGTGAGGVVELLGQPGKTLNVNNNGSIKAKIIGFNSFAGGGVALSGTGDTTASSYIAMGNLNSQTVYPLNPYTPPFNNPFSFAGFSATQANLSSPIVVSLSSAQPSLKTKSSESAAAPALPAAFLLSPESVSSVPTTSIDVDNLNIIPNTTIVPTDQTPMSRLATVRIGLDQRRARNSALDDSIQAAVATSADVNVLHGQGVIGETLASGAVKIAKGNVLFVAHENLSIETPCGQILLHQGNVLLLMVAGDQIDAFDLHDDPAQKPSLVAGQSTIQFSIGQEIVASRSSYAGMNPKIAFRAEQLLFKNGSTEVHCAQFSLPSAIFAVKPLHELQRSGQGEQRRVLQKLVKNAAVMAVLGARLGPFSKSPN